jgi:hypothetical protein
MNPILNRHKIAKITFISASLLLLATFPALAQKFYLGAKAGPLISWQAFGDKYDKKAFDKVPPVLGYYGGGIIGFPLSKDYSFQTEAGFSQKGRKLVYLQGGPGGAPVEHKATYYFIDLSMMLRREFPLRLGKDIPSKWFLNIGPNINYWLAGKGVIQDRYKYKIVFDEPNDGNYNNMYLNDVNRWLFGVDFGAGFHAPLRGNRRLMTEFRFTSGHTFYGKRDSHDIEILNFQDNLRSNQKVFSITVAYIVDMDIRQLRTGKSTKDKETHRKPVKKGSNKRRR